MCQLEKKISTAIIELKLALADAFFCGRVQPSTSIIKDVDDVADRRKEGSHVNSSFVVSSLLFLL